MKSVRRAVSILLGVGAIVGIALVLRNADSVSWPKPSAGLTAVALLLLANGFAGMASGLLIGRPFDAAVFRAFALSLFGRYLPGGIWQPAAQIALSNDAGVPLARLASAIPLSLLVGLAVCGLAGPALALSQPTHAWEQALLLASGLAVVLLWRPLIDGVLGLLARIHPKFAQIDVVDQRAILLAGLMQITNLTLQGCALGVLVGATTAELPNYALVFALAWAVGFLALPFPGGIGVREFVIVQYAPVAMPLALSSAVVHRIAGLVAELLLACGAMVWDRSKTRKRASNNNSR